MVTKLHPDFIVDKYNKMKAVVLPFEEWELVLEELEELADIKASDDAKCNPSDTISFERAVQEIHEQRID